jgi:hypothetical protein
MGLLTVEEFDRLSTTFEDRFWRWEAQSAYHEPEEAEPLARWQAGEADDLGWMAGWFDLLGEATRAGKRFERVRKLVDPPTDYLRWEMTIHPANIAAGEDIRLISEHEADALELPAYDFVLVDDRLVAKMCFGERGFVGAEVFTDAPTVDSHRTWRDLAWHHAASFTEYASRSP